MNAIRSSPFYLLLLFLPTSSPASAQATATDSLSSTLSTTAPASDPTPSREPASSMGRSLGLAIYTGQSFGYPQIMTGLDTQRMFLVGVRYTARICYGRRFDLNWNADLKPLALYSRDTPDRQYTYGGGGSIGLQVTPHAHWRWQPFFDVDGGVIGFTKNTPIPMSRRTNITLDFGPGVYIPLDSSHALKTGVWFLHFSNADTAPRNPGYDSFTFYIAYTFRRFSISQLRPR
jgi:Lipid A 3-O-deacylase (PagL)